MQSQSSLTTELVASQYEQWIYPRPVDDLSVPEERHLRAGCDPERLSAAYWPSRQSGAPLKMLIAGCGANLAARYAYHHPQSRVVGIDICRASLAHERHLKDKHGLDNLVLHQRRVEDAVGLGESFDFIDTTGVLHHLPAPVEGLRALGRVLEPDGVIFVMLYARYGRAGVYMLQELFRLLGLGQTEKDLSVVKECLSAIRPDHAIHRYLRRANDVDFDAGLVDTFLHTQDIPFTVADCLRLTDDAGLAFQGWVENCLYYPEGQISRQAPFFTQLDALPERLRWQALELVNGYLSQHCFYVCRRDRDPASYRIGFDTDEFMHYIPVPRWDLTARDSHDGLLVLERKPYPPVPLSHTQSRMMRQVDARRSIQTCLQRAGFSDPPAVAIPFCRALFRDLWRLGLIDFRFPRALVDNQTASVRTERISDPA